MHIAHGTHARIMLVVEAHHRHLPLNRLVDNFVVRKFLPPHLKSSARASPDYRRGPVLCTTLRVQSENLNRALETGARFFLRQLFCVAKN